MNSALTKDAAHPHVFFVGYGGGHITMLLPVAKALQARGYRISILGMTTAAAKVWAAGLPCLQFLDLRQFAAPGAEEYGMMLCPDPDLHGPVSPEETRAYHGINFADLVARHGEGEANALFEERGRQAFAPVDFMERVLEAFRPDLVIATNSPRAEKAALQAAGNLGIPAICAVDMFALQEVEWIGNPGFADRVCVLNPAIRQMMVDRGRRSDEVVVTGNPAFDTLFDPSVISAGMKLKAERSWNDGKVNILWASAVEPDRHPFTGEVGDPTLPRQIEAQLRVITAKDPRLRLIVRYHPSEQTAFIPDGITEFSPLSEHIHAVLHAVDIVVVTGSTVGLEASLIGKHVISLENSVFSQDSPYARLGMSVGAASPYDLARPVLEIASQLRSFPLSEPKRAPLQGGLATDNLLKVIDEILFHPSE